MAEKEAMSSEPNEVRIRTVALPARKLMRTIPSFNSSKGRWTRARAKKTELAVS